jgi:hypothetical protein
MNRWLAVALGMMIIVAAVSTAFTQGRRAQMHTRLSAMIEARMESQKPVRLSADSITLTGDTLRLLGHARVSWDDTLIRAEEIALNQTSKHVDFVGDVNALIHDATLKAPRVEFR